MHEFGHSLGLGDAYSGSVFGRGVDYSLFPDAKDTAMDYQYNKRPINNDIEMVILAFLSGKRKNFQKQFFWNNISKALGEGN